MQPALRQLVDYVKSTKIFRRNKKDCLFPKLFPTSTNSYVKLDEKAIKWIIREKMKGTPRK